MDPLSITASIVGILTAARKLGEILNVTISTAKDAPRVLTALACEIREIQAVLPSLQVFLTNLTAAQPHRAAMIQLDQLIVTLTEAALTLVELEKAITPFVVAPGAKIPVRVRLRWTRADSNCAKIVERLQRHKASMSLMLNILQCTSDAEAGKFQSSLERTVETLLQSNQQLCKRLHNLEDSFDARSTITKKFDNLSVFSEAADNATITSTRSTANKRVSILEAVRVHFAFDDDLQSSRVYRMVKSAGCNHSLVSSAIHTQTWSIFSGLSLADISIISVIALPLYLKDVKDHAQYYSFGTLEPSTPETTATWTNKQVIIDGRVPSFHVTSSDVDGLAQSPLCATDNDDLPLGVSDGHVSNVHDHSSSNSIRSDIHQVGMDMVRQLEASTVISVDPPDDTFNHESNATVHSCKGCGEILKEGKAFALAGHRWHPDCFFCNICGRLLDSDCHLLFLDDRSLVCNNCTYSCSHCGKNIEDLAFLTGDQAFCADCFTCRNCRRPIQNLRYARTIQGIFCLHCHESLTARRRKMARERALQIQSYKPLPDLPKFYANQS